MTTLKFPQHQHGSNSGTAPGRPFLTGSSHPERYAPDPRESVAADVIAARPSRAGFAALLGAYRSSGGSTRGEDLARLLADPHRGDCVSLTRLIENGDVFGFGWRESLWIPMFQFDARNLAVRQASREVLAELTPDFDGWTLAAWFANGNAWLDGRRPVDQLDVELPAVMRAARAHRCIA